MFCCFRPPSSAHDEVREPESSTAGSSSMQVAQQAASAKPACDAASPPVHVGKPPPGRRSNSLGSNPLPAPQQATLAASGGAAGAGHAPVYSAAKLGEGPPLHTAGAQHGGVAVAGETRGTAAAAPVDEGGQQGGVLKLVALLQELMALSTASPRQALSKAMSLLVVRLPVDWACLHAISNTGRVVMQVGAALSPEAQRQRGASGSCSHATPVHNTPVRQRYSMMQGGSSTGGGLSATPGGTGGLAVQEMGGGHLNILPGSGSSLEAVAASRQALAMYVGEEAQAGRLPKDWQRLHKDRDLRSFLAVPIIASGSSGSIIGALSFGLTSISDWGSAWWMGSIQLLCGWAAGALPQNRATARACFFDALWAAQDLDSMGRVFVHHLPHALVDLSVNKLEARLALVSSRLANCIIYASQPDRSSTEPHQQQLPPLAAPQQQQQRAHQQATQQQQHAAHQSFQQLTKQQSPSAEPGQCGGKCGSSRPPTPPDVVPEGVILTGDGDNSVVGNSSSDNDAKQDQHQIDNISSDAYSQEHHPVDKAGMNGLGTPSTPEAAEPVSRFSLPTSNSVLLSALEWGEVMVVKDTVTYFGRNAGGGAVKDLFLPDRPMVRGTLVLLPLLFRCRPLGCVYLLAPWDIHAALGKAALQEMAALLAAGTFKALLAGGSLQQQWYEQVLSEGPVPGLLQQTPAATAAGQCKVGAAAAVTAGEQQQQQRQQQQQQQQQQTVEQQRVPSVSFSRSTPPATYAAAATGTSNAIGAVPVGGRSAALPDAHGSSDGAVGGSIITSVSPDSSTGAAEQRQSLLSSAVASTVASLSAAAAVTSLTNGSSSSSTAAHSCPLPLGTAAAAAEASAAAAAAAQSAATLAPVGLAVSGHACSGFPELVLWPELLDVKEDLARSRHTAVYTAEHASHLLAVKLFRFSSSMDHGPAAGHAPGISHGPIGGAAGAGSSTFIGSSSGSSGNVVRETELEAVLSLQYRLCNLLHPHILKHVAVYPHAYEVVHRRSSREPPDVYLTSILPRKERHHRCAALVTEYAAGGCLRDAVNRGAVYVPTSKALQSAAEAAGLGKVQELSALSVQQLAVLLAQLEQQLPLAPAVPQVQQCHSADMQHAPQPAAALLGGLLGPAPPGQLTQPVPGLSAGRRSHEAAAEHMREPHIPLLRTLLLHIALGMQHLHANGIVHGELRLDNVMVSGQLPSTLQLLQQQQVLQPEAVACSHAHSNMTQQQQQPCGGVGTVAAADPFNDQSNRTNSSVGSVTSPDTAQAGSSHVSSIASSGSTYATGHSNTFTLKLKDIGLCTIGWSHRQVSMRKLAGRPRLQAVSWLAPECFRGDGLSKHSDVYAFGILMWELYTGQVAFNDLVTGNSKVLQTIITDGVRPQFPDSAPSWYVTLASRCWSGTAKNRPSFRRIVAQLQALEKPLAAHHEQQQQQHQQGQQQRQQQQQQPDHQQQQPVLLQDGVCAALHSSQL